MIWLPIVLVLALAACVLTAPSIRCRLNWHRWRRLPVLAPTDTPGPDGLVWEVVCANCELRQADLRGVAE